MGSSAGLLWVQVCCESLVKPEMLHVESGRRRRADTDLHTVFPSWAIPRILHGLEMTSVTSQ
jgi:hypothetical protein